jgi:hypothetical protein
MASPVIPSLLAAAVVAMPVAAGAQQAAQPMQTVQTISTAWVLEAPGGSPISCVKKAGAWPGEVRSEGGYIKDDLAVFQCGAIKITRTYDRYKEQSLFGPASWSVTDKAGKKWPALVDRYRESQLLTPLGAVDSRVGTALEVGGQRIYLVQISKGRLVPVPQPIFR